MQDEITTTDLQSYSPQGLISQALAQNLPVETLERLMDLADRWEAKQAKSAFLKAMSVFQGKVPSILKTKKGHNNEYAPLPKITKTIQPLLEECGLSYRWSFDDVEGQIKCTCIVSHVDGHSITDCMTAEKDTSGNKSNIHAIGSTRTYLQRYTLIGALGLSTVDKDDDGNKSTSGKKEDIPEPKEKVDWSKLIKNCESIKDLKAIWARMSESEQGEHRESFNKIKSNIESATKKEKTN
jgi:hypothetical protein